MKNDSGMTANHRSVELVAYDREDNLQTFPLPPDADPLEIESALRAGGCHVAYAKLRRPARAVPRGVSAENFARFNELLASAVRRKMPLLRGVRKVACEVRSRRFREALNRIAYDLERGEPLERAFGSVESGFPPLYGRLMAAGAASGNLADVLVALSRNIRADVRFRRDVCEALVYPVFLFFMCLCFVPLFVVVLLPHIQSIGGAMNMRPHPIAGFLSWLGGGGPASAPLVGLGVFAVIMLGILLLPALAFARALHEAVMRRLPFFGGMHESAVWAAAADTLRMLFKARVPAPAALSLAGPATGSRWVERVFERMADEVERGHSLSDAAHLCAEVPAPVVRAFDKGEVHGDLGASLGAVAREYRQISTYQARRFVNYLPPVLACVVGIGLLLVALAVLGPYIDFCGAPW